MSLSRQSARASAWPGIWSPTQPRTTPIAGHLVMLCLEFRGMVDKSSKTDVELLLLGILRNSPAHGYGIIVALRERSSGEFDFAEGTIYPALHRLERAGLIESAIESANGRRRRTYALTPKGHRAFVAQLRGWQSYVAGMKAVIA